MGSHIDISYDEQLKSAVQLWDEGFVNDSILELRRLVYDDDYLLAYPEYLRRIWGNGQYYDEFNQLLEHGIEERSLACEYLKIWKEFSNRPSVDEYWDRISTLALKGQKNARLALAMRYLQFQQYEMTLKCMNDAYPCMSSVENLALMYPYFKSRESFFRKIIPNCQRWVHRVESYIRQHDSLFAASDGVITTLLEPIRLQPWPVNTDKLMMHEISNEEFNAHVFSRLRMLERKRIQQGTALSYSQIVDELVHKLRAFPDLYIMTGLTKNSWSLSDNEKDSAKERSSIYVMKHTCQGWMTLRIGDHTPNMQDYYKYRRMFIPSTERYANMCLMFHGDREQDEQLSYSFRFRPETADPCVTVRDEDFVIYRPFMYMLVHYIPGLIENIDPLVENIRKWFDGEGKNPYQDPWWQTSENGPWARTTSGCVTIETWKMKYDRRERKRQSSDSSIL